MREIDLKSLEQAFNLIYGFEKLECETKKILEKIVGECSNNFLKNEESSLPKGLSYSDLKVQYRQINVFLNNSDRNFPYFRVCFDLIHPNTEIQIFYYHVDYDMDGNFSDEYFGRY